MPYVLSDSFKKVLRDSTTPIVVLAETYRNSSLHSVSVYSLFPFELCDFLEHFRKPSFQGSSVSFFCLFPPTSGNEFSKYHIVTLWVRKISMCFFRILWSLKKLVETSLLQFVVLQGLLTLFFQKFLIALVLLYPLLLLVPYSVIIN